MTRFLHVFSIILVSFLCGCSLNSGNEKNILESPPDTESGKNRQQKVVAFHAGDLDTDGTDDSAYVTYKTVIYSDGSCEYECVREQGGMVIRFKKGIPEINLPHCTQIDIHPCVGMKNAGNILVFTRGYEGFWGHVHLFRLDQSSWQETGKTKAFLAEPCDFEGRIEEQNGDIFLLGDSWNDSMGIMPKIVRVKI